MDIYESTSLFEKLLSNAYPGRGIVLGLTPDGSRSVAAYFIMGRSANSRNRLFVETADGIRTEANDPAKLEDPSLIIYHPVRQSSQGLLVTNGDQTDTISTALTNGGSFEAALHTRAFEPDSPHFTPRISGLLSADGSYRLSILKAADAAGIACTRQFFDYPPLPGLGHFIHTYVRDGAPLPSFQGEPERVDLCDDMNAFAQKLWNSLHEENKISLFVRYTSLATGSFHQRIFNKHTERTHA